MAGILHLGLDRLFIASSALVRHNPLKWVEPPEVNVDIPMGDDLPEPDRLGVVWPREACVLEVPAPTRFLEAPNDRMYIHFWPARGPRRGAVVLAPPWKFTVWASLWPVARVLNALGFDVAGYSTPYHFERTPPGAFSGELFATWDMPRTGWAVRAAVLELCALIESLQSRGPVALLGTSLGGYLSAMTTVVSGRYPRRAFVPERVCLVVPPDSILDTFLKSPIGERYRRLLLANGGSIPDEHFLRHLSRPFSPSNFAPAVPGERIQVLAARHDVMVPLESSQRLAAAWGARFRVYEAGHVSALGLSWGVWRDAAGFLEEVPRAGQGPGPERARERPGA
ncbi:MAG: hypothetical protein HY904_21485 [Deltaproteobacteria bacterium]|nr:hypothetical protein [Deltaproteobacteria bacterium]